MKSRLKANLLGMIGLFLLLFVTGVAIFAPWIAPYPEDAGQTCHLEAMLQPPCRSHLLGTDDMGRDLFSRIIFGARISLLIGAVSVAFSTCAGGLLGLIAGYFGGVIDEIIMRIADIFMSVPYVILGMAIAVALKPGVRNLIMVIALVFWPALARVMRGAVLTVRERDFVEAAKAIGASHWRIMLVHLLPNCVTPVLVQATIQVGWAIMLAATLSFIGVGVQPPLPEWGLITSTGRQFMLYAWWYPVFPGVAIVITVLAFNFLGDFLREKFDPTLRR